MPPGAVTDPEINTIVSGTWHKRGPWRSIANIWKGKGSLGLGEGICAKRDGLRQAASQIRQDP